MLRRAVCLGFFVFFRGEDFLIGARDIIKWMRRSKPCGYHRCLDRHPSVSRSCILEWRAWESTLVEFPICVILFSSANTCSSMWRSFAFLSSATSTSILFDLINSFRGAIWCCGFVWGLARSQANFFSSGGEVFRNWPCCFHRYLILFSDQCGQHDRTVRCTCQVGRLTSSSEIFFCLQVGTRPPYPGVRYLQTWTKSSAELGKLMCLWNPLLEGIHAFFPQFVSNSLEHNNSSRKICVNCDYGRYSFVIMRGRLA